MTLRDLGAVISKELAPSGVIQRRSRNPMVRYRFDIESPYRRTTPHDSADQRRWHRRMHLILQDGTAISSRSRQNWPPNEFSNAESVNMRLPHDAMGDVIRKKMWYRGMANVTGVWLRNSNGTVVVLGLGVGQEGLPSPSEAKVERCVANC